MKYEEFKEAQLNPKNIKKLITHFKVSPVDIAEYCDITLQTFNWYMSQGIPRKTVNNIRAFFQEKYNNDRLKVMENKMKKKKVVEEELAVTALEEVKESSGRGLQEVSQRSSSENETDPISHPETVSKKPPLNDAEPVQEESASENEPDPISENKNGQNLGHTILDDTDEEEENQYPHINNEFKHLKFVSIIFESKGDLGAAIKEAVLQSDKSSAPISVLHDGLTYRVEAVKNDTINVKVL